ncbi:helix-turn-helix domain-containing protein [Priestia sp. OVS21]|nr:helix-turn-helix domain-containing protein [Priestia sp. OVS21]
MRNWLIEIRGDLSQQFVASEAGIDRGSYSNIELGKRNPSVSTAKKIAQALNFEWTIFLKKMSSK